MAIRVSSPASPGIPSEYIITALRKNYFLTVHANGDITDENNNLISELDGGDVEDWNATYLYFNFSEIFTQLGVETWEEFIENHTVRIRTKSNTPGGMTLTIPRVSADVLYAFETFYLQIERVEHLVVDMTVVFKSQPFSVKHSVNPDIPAHGFQEGTTPQDIVASIGNIKPTLYLELDENKKLVINPNGAQDLGYVGDQYCQRLQIRIPEFDFPVKTYLCIKTPSGDISYYDWWNTKGLHIGDNIFRQAGTYKLQVRLEDAETGARFYSNTISVERLP